MLTELHIREYALVEELRVEFGPGLTVLSGETGAGKSILLGALSFVLGERVDSDVIRAGSDTATVEAVLDLSGTEDVVRLLDTQGVEVETGVLILQRELGRNSRGRCHANNSPITLGVLKRIGDELVDFHGQHAHQLLLNSERHLDFLDGFGQLTDLGLRAREAFQQCAKLKGEAKALAEREASLRERRDLYEFQEREIRLARIVPGEEEALKEKKNLWENAEKLSILVGGILRRLEEGEGAVLGSLRRSERDLDEIARLDPEATREKEPLGQALIHLEELRRSLEAYGQRLQFEPVRLEEVRDRLDLLRRLKQKYGGTLETVLQHGEEVGKALRSLESGEEEREILSGRLRTAESILAETCGELSRQRRKAARQLEKRVQAELADLGMEKAVFRTEIRPCAEPGSRGGETVEFLLSANPGEPPKALARVASGGELSRIMLALKTVLSDVDRVGTLVFDEIDTGIGGRVAEAVGAKLAAVAKRRQVLCITHLPQIARFAQTHFVVAKKAQGNRTVTTLGRLGGEERVREMARMLAGKKVTQLTLAHAREMLEAKSEGVRSSHG